ncbi:MAG: hypothetical protein AAGA15_15940 [Pseudomonadota bacterium]
MAIDAKEAQRRAVEMGLTSAKAGLVPEAQSDVRSLTIACLATPLTALSLYAALLNVLALLIALPLAAALAFHAAPMRRYFIAFSPRNAFPRNLPAFARWAALYSGAMLVMIALPPTLSIKARAATWLILASAVLLFPLIKARHRAGQVWRP